MILRAAAEGRTDKQIALELGLSLGTVRTYWGRIRHKLGASTRAQSVGIFIRSKPSPGTSQSVQEPILHAEAMARTLGLPAWVTKVDGTVCHHLTALTKSFLARLQEPGACYPCGWLSTLKPRCREAVISAMKVRPTNPSVASSVVRLECTESWLNGHVLILRPSGRTSLIHIVYFPEPQSPLES